LVPPKFTFNNLFPTQLETGSNLNPSTGLLIAPWIVALIVVGGVLILTVLVVIITAVRIRNRSDASLLLSLLDEWNNNITNRAKLVQIRLDATENVAKEDNFRAIYEYQAQNPDEMDLRVGDVVHVTQKHEDGWWAATSYRLKGKSGMVPGNYLEEIPSGPFFLSSITAWIPSHIFYFRLLCFKKKKKDRLMWVERPKTVFGRISQRVSNFFSGATQYGTDPQAVPQSRFSQRISRAFGAAPPQQSQLSLYPSHSFLLF